MLNIILETPLGPTHRSLSRVNCRAFCSLLYSFIRGAGRISCIKGKPSLVQHLLFLWRADWHPHTHIHIHYRRDYYSIYNHKNLLLVLNIEKHREKIYSVQIHRSMSWYLHKIQKSNTRKARMRRHFCAEDGAPVLFFFTYKSTFEHRLQSQ